MFVNLIHSFFYMFSNLIYLFYMNPATTPSSPTTNPLLTRGIVIAAAPVDGDGEGDEAVVASAFCIATPATPVLFLHSSSERSAAVLLNVISAHYPHRQYADYITPFPEPLLLSVEKEEHRLTLYKLAPVLAICTICKLACCPSILLLFNPALAKPASNAARPVSLRQKVPFPV